MLHNYININTLTPGQISEKAVIPFIDIVPKTHNVLITGANGNLGTACIEKCIDSKWKAYPIVRETVDLSQWFAVENWVNEHHVDYDLVIMAHGTQIPSPLARIEASEWERVLKDNLTSCVALIHSLMFEVRIRPGGLVVFLSSIHATQPRFGRGAYAAAKAGVEGLMRATSVELQDINARAIALRLGQMTETMGGIEFSEDQIKHLTERIPSEWVEASRVADLIFSFYDQPSLTGQVIEISSGHNLNIW